MPGRRGAFIHETPFGPLAFKPVGKKPVKGGRWKVRRGYGVKPWRAWCNGAALRFNRSFETHQEAIEHAAAIAQMFAEPTRERVEATLRRYMPHWSDEAIERNVQRYVNGVVPHKFYDETLYRWVACGCAAKKNHMETEMKRWPRAKKGARTDG